MKLPAARDGATSQTLPLAADTVTSKELILGCGN